MYNLAVVADVSLKKIYYESLGDGNKTILLVHGWGGSHKSMEKLASLLVSSYKVFIIDLPGFGESSNPEPDWGVDGYAEFIKEFIEEFKLQGCVYVGHSFGGAIGVYLGAKYPGLFSKLVLLAPSYKRESKDSDPNVSYSSFKKFLAPVRKIAYRVLYPNSQALAYPHLETNFRKIVSQDLTASISDIKVPTLILWGSQDSFVPLEHGKVLNDGIKGSVMKVYDGFDHGVPFLNSDKVSEDISSFVELK